MIVMGCRSSEPFCGDSSVVLCSDCRAVDSVEALIAYLCVCACMQDRHIVSGQGAESDGHAVRVQVQSADRVKARATNLIRFCI